MIVSTTPITYSAITYTGLTLMPSAVTPDDAYIEVPFPPNFSSNFLCRVYDRFYLTTNGYITFSAGTTAFGFDIPNDIPSFPQLPGVYLSTATGTGGPTDSCMDGYLLNWYSGFTGSGNVFIVAFSGTPLTETTQLNYSFVFYKNQPSYFDLVIKDNSIFCKGDSTGGVSDGVSTTFLATFDSTGGTAYRITTDLAACCECYDFQPQLVCNGSTVYYQDCDFNEVSMVVSSGLPYRICSSIYPTSDCIAEIIFTSNGQCSGGICPTPIPTLTPTPTQMLTPTPTPTISVTPTPTKTPNQPITPTPTPTLTKTPNLSSTPTPTPTKTKNPFITPTQTPTNTVTPSITPTNTVTPSITPTNTPTPSVTKTPLPTPSFNPNKGFYNECEPITIFDMGISCVVLEPSSTISNDGAASLEISGGTPPYTITWDNGNVAPAIGNLTVGSYGATVVDYYGDFTAKTICVLTGQTIQPTPTPTPTLSPIPNGPNICFKLSAVVDTGKGVKTIAFISTLSTDSFINGKLSWCDPGNNYRVYWNTSVSPNYWQLSGTTLSPLLVYNTNPTSPPTNNGWVVVGGASPSVQVTEGSCSLFELNPLSISNPDIELYVVKNNPICGCEGSIMATASGGNQPYQYSIDGGISFKNFPIFDNLCFGNYTVLVKDYSGYTKSSQITIDKPQLPTTYVVNLTKTTKVIVDNGLVTSKSYESKLVVNPPLPDTTTITFDIVHTNNFQSSTTSSSASLNTNTELTIDGTPYSFTYDSTSTGTTLNLNDGCQDKLIYLTGTSQIWQGLTYNNTNDLTIKTTTTVTKNFTTGCDIGSSEDSFYITNLKINGCNCCTVQNITL